MGIEEFEINCPDCGHILKKINISNFKEDQEFNFVCGKCKHPISMKLSKKIVFPCNKCDKNFNTEQEAKEHEEKCQEERQEFQFFCPYCDLEKSAPFDLSGQSGKINCGTCNKEFKYTFGKVTHAGGFTGYIAKQGFLRMIINGREEQITWYADSSVDLKRNDLILIIWKKRLFNPDKPHQILNYTTGARSKL